MTPEAGGETVAAAAPPTRNPLKRLYHWILSWAHHRWGTWALAVFAFLDSAVFPIPPLFLQVAMSLERPKRSWWYATVDTVASVAGAVLGYGIGYFLWDSIGVWVTRGGISDDTRQMLLTNAFGVTLLYSFVPLPYKLITIGSGFLHLNLGTLLIASTIGRSARFYLLGALCYFKGPAAKDFIERRFNLVTFGVGVVIACAAVLMKVVLKK